MDLYGILASPDGSLREEYALESLDSHPNDAAYGALDRSSRKPWRGFPKQTTDPPRVSARKHTVHTEKEGDMHEVEKLDHVAFAVRDKGSAASFLTRILGAREVMDMEWGGFRFTSFLLGSGSMLELVYSSDPENFVNRFIARRGEGLHHLTFKVSDLEGTVEYLRRQGLNPFDINTSNPLWKECYLHPREALGTLIQFAEFPEEEWVKIWAQGQGG